MLGYDAARWHAVLNDLPAALLLVAVLFDFAAAKTKRESLMWAAIWTLWAGVIGGWAAVVAGKIASGSIEHGEAIHEIMEKHENVALITMSLFTVVLGWRLIRRLQMPAQELALTRMPQRITAPKAKIRSTPPTSPHSSAMVANTKSVWPSGR